MSTEEDQPVEIPGVGLLTPAGWKMTQLPAELASHERATPCPVFSGPGESRGVPDIARWLPLYSRLRRYTRAVAGTRSKPELSS